MIRQRNYGMNMAQTPVLPNRALNLPSAAEPGGAALAG